MPVRGRACQSWQYHMTRVLRRAAQRESCLGEGLALGGGAGMSSPSGDVVLRIHRKWPLAQSPWKEAEGAGGPHLLPLHPLLACPL